MTEPTEDRIAQRSRELLTDSAAQLDADTRRRLAQARYAALEARPTRRFAWRYAASAVAAAVIATLVATLWLTPTDAPRPPIAEQALADLELLTSDNPDFYAELEFYEWLADPNHAG